MQRGSGGERGLRHFLTRAGIGSASADSGDE
jgi:hypothetical protein